MNALSFRLSPWYSSGIFALTMIILISIYAIVFDGVSPLITALFSSVITLPVPYGGGGGYNGLLIALGIKPGACGLGGYGFSTCGLLF